MDIIPIIGLGTGRLTKIQTKISLTCALNNNYRLVDTGENYNNEEIVGECIYEYLKNNPNNKIMVITKYFGGQNFGKKNDLINCFYKSLKKLKLLSIDIYLIHMPGGCIFERNVDRRKSGWKYLYNEVYNLNTRINSWKELLFLKKQGLVKYIGVSNWDLKKILELKKNNLDYPDIIEIEWCTCYRNFELLDFCKKNNIIVIGYGSLRRNLNFGKYKGNKNIFDKENIILKKIALKYKRNIFDILLKWCSQHGIIVIPSSKNANHIKNNFNIINSHFKLENEDMKIINNFQQTIKGHSLHNLY